MLLAIPVSYNSTRYFLNQAYMNWVTKAGFTPIAVTPQMNMDTVVNLCGGLLLPGGIDLDPIRYGDDNWASAGVDRFKDAFERKLLGKFCATTDKPIFGVCRGFQLIAREFVRSVPSSSAYLEYIQDIGAHNQGVIETPRHTPSHRIKYDPSLFFLPANAEGKMSRGFVNSMHHQGLRLLGKVPANASFKVLAAAGAIQGKDTQINIVEAFEISLDNGNKVRAVQWHPEELSNTALIQGHFGLPITQPEEDQDRGGIIRVRVHRKTTSQPALKSRNASK